MSTDLILVAAASPVVYNYNYRSSLSPYISTGVILLLGGANAAAECRGQLPRPINNSTEHFVGHATSQFTEPSNTYLLPPEPRRTTLALHLWSTFIWEAKHSQAARIQHAPLLKSYRKELTARSSMVDRESLAARSSRGSLNLTHPGCC